MGISVATVSKTVIHVQKIVEMKGLRISYLYNLTASLYWSLSIGPKPKAR